MTDVLREALKTHAGELSQRVLDRMYENPFWMQRYGARGRRFADEDSLHHIRYLEQALAEEQPALFERYARWLRSVLVSRGMCSEHLAENFHLLAAEIASRGWPSSGDARTILEAGAAALIYQEGGAAQLERHRSTLLAAVERAPAGASMRADDRRYLVSYLIDAAATQQQAGFEAFAATCDPRVVQALRTAVRDLHLADR